MHIGEKEHAIRIISEAFQDNPSVLSVIKQDGKSQLRIRHLADYAYRTSKMRNGVFFSKDHEAVAFCYRYNEKKETLVDYWNQVKLVMRVIGLSRLFEVLKRDSYIKRQRPKSGNFLYFWFYGVSDKQRGGRSAWELKRKIFSMADREKLPILLETSVPQNRRVYERFGFETYHTWDQKGNGQPLWFMKRMPQGV